jgi:hypothetical protein
LGLGVAAAVSLMGLVLRSGRQQADGGPAALRGPIRITGLVGGPTGMTPVRLPLFSVADIASGMVHCNKNIALHHDAAAPVR